MRQLKTGVLLALFAAFLSSPAQAATITFDQAGFADGTLFWDGNAGSPIFGDGITFDRILGEDTPLNDGGALACTGCVLSFITGGAFDTTYPTAEFGGGAGTFFTVTGSVASLGLVNQVLLTGSVSYATATKSSATGITVSVYGPDTKHDAIVAYYGLTGYSFDYQSTNIEGQATFTGNSFVTQTVDEADIVNTAAEPASFAMLAFGLAGLGALRRKVVG